MAEKRYRWVCPQCKIGKLGTSRPRKNATIRYCLPCSEKCGTLVERTCPALEKVRHAKVERSKKKLEKRKARESQKRTFDGVDIEREMLFQCRALCKAGVWPKRLRRGIKIIVHKSKYKKRARGLCYHSHITLTVGEDVDRHTLKELIFHELTHAACGHREGHGDGFRSKLVEGARVLWGIVIEMGPKNVYDLDGEIADRLRGLEGER